MRTHTLFDSTRVARSALHYSNYRDSPLCGGKKRGDFTDCFVFLRGEGGQPHTEGHRRLGKRTQSNNRSQTGVGLWFGLPAACGTGAPGALSMGLMTDNLMTLELMTLERAQFSWDHINSGKCSSSKA